MSLKQLLNLLVVVSQRDLRQRVNQSRVELAKRGDLVDNFADARLLVSGVTGLESQS